jgi:hypothetical protein
MARANVLRVALDARPQSPIRYNGLVGTLLSAPGVSGGGGESRCLVELHDIPDKVLNVKTENLRAVAAVSDA